MLAEELQEQLLLEPSTTRLTSSSLYPSDSQIPQEPTRLASWPKMAACCRWLLTILLAVPIVIFLYGLNSGKAAEFSMDKKAASKDAGQGSDGSPPAASVVADAAETAAFCSAVPLCPEELLPEATDALSNGASGRMENLRGFVVLHIVGPGLVLLWKKKKKKTYLQLPGGRADWTDFPTALASLAQRALQDGELGKHKSVELSGKSLSLGIVQNEVQQALTNRATEQSSKLGQCGDEHQKDNTLKRQHLLLAWARVAAARELFEETGIDLRDQLESLVPLCPVFDSNVSSFFFFVQLELSAAQTAAAAAVAVIPPDGSYVAMQSTAGKSLIPLSLRIDLQEHTGFTFQPEVVEAAEQVIKHSRGSCTKALLQLWSLMNLPPKL